MIDTNSGENISNISIGGYTPRENYFQVDSAATVWSGDALLLQIRPISTDLDTAGNASTWMFIYYSSSLNEYMAFFAGGGRFLQMEPAPWHPPSPIPLPPAWINSDSALTLAAENGGKAFCAQHADTDVQAILARGYYPFDLAQAAWKVTFHAGSDTLVLCFDAESGKPLSDTPKTKITAKEMLANVQQQALAWSADARLTFVQPTCTTDVSPTCPAWSYTYYSPTLAKHRNFVLSADGSITEHDPLAMPPSTEALPSNWLDSGLIMSAAQNNGGADYMVRNDSVRVIVQFSKNIYNFYGVDSQAAWQFVYVSDSAEHLRLYIDAESGAVLYSTAPTTSSAAFNLKAANLAASILGADAKLVSMKSSANIGQSGLAESWRFVYYSASANAFRDFTFYSAALVNVNSNNDGITTTAALADGWNDSVQPLPLAEAAGGNTFRLQHSDTRVTAFCRMNVTLPGYTIPANRAVWVIRYTSKSGNAESVFVYDAETNQPLLPTAVNATQGNSIPSRYTLQQNYPNPFNHKTAIEYGLPQGGHVVLSIFNLNGQLMRQVENAPQNAGIHRTVWDGKNTNNDLLPSRIYVYQLNSGRFSCSRRMVFIR